MNDSSRRWFDYAYRFIGGNFPFCILTGILPIETYKEIKGSWPEEVLREVKERAEIFYSKLPSEKDFLEEKGRIYPDLRRDLKALLPSIETSITFGSVKGDIDVGFISSQTISEDILEGLIYGGADIVKKYPIVDWDGCFKFRARDGHELASQIEGSRLDSTKVLKPEELSEDEMLYIADTILNARLLFGNSGELEKMVSFICDFKKE